MYVCVHVFTVYVSCGILCAVGGEAESWCKRETDNWRGLEGEGNTHAHTQSLLERFASLSLCVQWFHSIGDMLWTFNAPLDQRLAEVDSSQT